jgi:hypothetical protein
VAWCTASKATKALNATLALERDGEKPCRFPFYIVLLIGTVMVTFTGRCFIALVLKVLPWNKNLAPGASCEIGSAEK